MNRARVAPLRLVKPHGGRRPGVPGRAVLRTAAPADAAAIHALILDHRHEGHLLPRRIDEIEARAGRFVVAAHRGRVVACGELAPLSRSVAEIRSLVVSGDARSSGLSRRIVDELTRRAVAAGFERLCAFTHSPAYFVRLGFSIVPHQWLPEKIATDCQTCAHFRQCGQYAVVSDLSRRRDAGVPLAALNG